MAKASEMLKEIDEWKRDGKLRLDAYYYSFEPTGDEVIDRILSAVAIAGKMYHNTDCWTDDWAERGWTPVDLIQAAANAAANTRTEPGEGGGK